MKRIIIKKIIKPIGVINKILKIKNFGDNNFHKNYNKPHNNQKKIEKTTSKERHFLQNYNPNPNAKIKIIPLGGLDEIGMNITVFEDDKDIIIVDCGLAFPSEDLLGIDLVIPDIKYLKKHTDKIRGMVITHGHEDHIGDIPYIIKI